MQIVVGSFLPSYPMEQKNKKPRVVAAPSLPETPPVSSTETHSSEQGQHSCACGEQNWAPPAQAVVTEEAPSGDPKVTTA
jgi:hypothetical protein